MHSALCASATQFVHMLLTMHARSVCPLLTYLRKEHLAIACVITKPEATVQNKKCTAFKWLIDLDYDSVSYITRMSGERFPAIVLHRNVHGARKRGRQRKDGMTTWKHTWKKCMGKTMVEAVRLASSDREECGEGPCWCCRSVECHRKDTIISQVSHDSVSGAQPVSQRWLDVDITIVGRTPSQYKTKIHIYSFNLHYSITPQ